MASSISAAAWTLARRLTPAPLVPLARRLFNLMIANKDWTEQEELILHLIVPRNRGSVDVGANLGSYTRRLSKLTAFVHAYEPDTQTAQLLQSVGLPNVTVHNKAVSDEIGQITYRVPIVDGHRVVSIAAVAKTFNGKEFAGKQFAEQTVPKTTLDELVGENIGFVKIDVEGHELELLNGARKLLTKHRPIVLIEAEDRYRPNAVRDVMEYFGSIGYAGLFIYERSARAISELTPKMTDTRELNRPVAKRVEQGYVSNFLFFPTHEAAAHAAGVLNAYFQSER
jgi:FkbM family methyltransferase